ncbi:hypothetical protein KP509_21G035300 [Ceratopteris richardii]|uniref:DNA-directed RNA polymerase n=1 Tax=Ceratopteris richardii TaxID=49495 RepID=A0A8T2SC87_CERRI|nr:hypothetical protein KP509_21G035300 [Ceratopteris richardii]
MIHRTNYKQLCIELASPEQILTWAERKFPNGDIVGQTHKPEWDGSLCKRIFGPIKSGVCACGNYHSINNEDTSSTFCKQCGVEFTDSRVRRYRMGYIKLACLVTDVWFSKRVPSYIANSLTKHTHIYSIIERERLNGTYAVGRLIEDIDLHVERRRALELIDELVPCACIPQK